MLEHPGTPKTRKFHKYKTKNSRSLLVFEKLEKELEHIWTEPSLAAMLTSTLSCQYLERTHTEEAKKKNKTERHKPPNTCSSKRNPQSSGHH
jgi:tRNA nucleotidyltransferase/poly(A) polymerase